MVVVAGATMVDFWELLHAALGLQRSACTLAEEGRSVDALAAERQAISLLLEATCLLEPDEPALTTVRMLATSGLARLRALRHRAPARARTRKTSPRVSSGTRRRKVVELGARSA